MQESRADLIVVLIPPGVVGLLRMVQTGATREEINERVMTPLQMFLLSILSCLSCV
jgi:hypothetical protein